MVTFNAPLSSDAWIRDVFACNAAQQGEILRCHIRDIERHAGIEAFLSEVEARGFQALENCGHIIVFCNRAAIRMLI